MPRKVVKTKPPAGLAFRPAIPPRPCWLCREAPRISADEWLCVGCREHEKRCQATVKRVNKGRRAERLSPTEERGRGL